MGLAAFGWSSSRAGSIRSGIAASSAWRRSTGRIISASKAPPACQEGRPDVISSAIRDLYSISDNIRISREWTPHGSPRTALDQRPLGHDSWRSTRAGRTRGLASAPPSGCQTRQNADEQGWHPLGRPHPIHRYAGWNAPEACFAQETLIRLRRVQDARQFEERRRRLRHIFSPLGSS